MVEPESFLRFLYAPIQPGVKFTDNFISYQEFLPHPDLQELIYCYWQLQTKVVLAQPFNYRVVTDGCIDIFFEVDSPAKTFIMGFCKSYTSFELPQTFNYFGIRFLPTKFPLFFGVNASTLTDNYKSLHIAAPNIAKFIAENVKPKNELNSQFDQYFCSLLGNFKPKDDQRLGKAIAKILKSNGNLQVDKDLDVGISIRQLRRLFEFYIGTTPKTFSKVVRFQHVLRINEDLNKNRLTDLFLSTGYFDQAHFIKEFKKMYGLTPNQALRK